MSAMVLVRNHSEILRDILGYNIAIRYNTIQYNTIQYDTRCSKMAKKMVT